MGTWSRFPIHVTACSVYDEMSYNIRRAIDLVTNDGGRTNSLGNVSLTTSFYHRYRLTQLQMIGTISVRLPWTVIARLPARDSHILG